MSGSFNKSWSGDYGGDLRHAIKKELLQIGLDGERYISKVIANKNISVDGDLKKSVTSALDEPRGSFRLEIGPSVDYAPFVQFPTRPHWAPIAPLKRWVRRKFGGDERDAYAVQWKIRNEGTDGQDFLTGPFGKLKRETPGRLEDAMQEALDD